MSDLLHDIDTANNLVELFLKRADALRDRPFLGTKRAGSWETISWGEAADRVCLLAQSLRAMGLADGDRSRLYRSPCLGDPLLVAYLRRRDVQVVPADLPPVGIAVRGRLSRRLDLRMADQPWRSGVGPEAFRQRGEPAASTPSQKAETAHGSMIYACSPQI